MNNNYRICSDKSALCLYTVTGWGVMSCVCGMAFLCGSTLFKVPLLQVGTVAMLNPNKHKNKKIKIICFVFLTDATLWRPVELLHGHGEPAHGHVGAHRAHLQVQQGAAFFEMLVPTTDTIRFGYLLEKLLSIKQSVLFTGDTGVGKVCQVLWGLYSKKSFIKNNSMNDIV